MARLTTVTVVKRVWIVMVFFVFFLIMLLVYMGTPAKNSLSKLRKPTRFVAVGDIATTNSDNCRLLQRQSETSWQMLRYIPFKIPKPSILYLLHSYYDGRDERNKVVKLYTISNVHKIKSIYCYFWTGAGCEESPIRSKGAYKKLLAPQQSILVEGLKYYSSQLVCNVPKTTSKLQFKGVSISTDRRQLKLSNYVPIYYPQKPQKYAHEFGVCVVVSYGRMVGQDKLTSMIEWFEFNRLLGVTEFNIYNASLEIDSAMKRLFEYYVNKSVLHVRKHATPFDKETSDGHRLLFYSSLGDCLYRNMYRYKYVITIDFDEIIVPVRMRSYRQLLQEYENSTGHVPLRRSLRFKTHSYYKDQTPDLAQPSRLPSLQYRQHWFDPLRIKSMHNPRLCTNYMLQHFCSPNRALPILSETVASVHHYRVNCMQSHFQSTKDPGERVRSMCQKHLNTTALIDDDILLFKSDLLKRVNLVYTELFPDES